MKSLPRAVSLEWACKIGLSIAGVIALSFSYGDAQAAAAGRFTYRERTYPNAQAACSALLADLDPPQTLKQADPPDEYGNVHCVGKTNDGEDGFDMYQNGVQYEHAAGGTPEESTSAPTAAPTSDLDARLAEAQAEFDQACGKALAYKAARAAAGKSLKGGDSKGIWNAKEHIWLLKRQKAFPDRTILGQVKIVGVRSNDGTVKTADSIAGKGRTADYLEVRGSKKVAGDLKSANELKSSIAGGLKKPGPIECEFRDSSKIAGQHEVEEKILAVARQQDGKIVLSGRNVLTDKIETIEVEPANYGSEVVPYESVLPD